MSRGLSRYIPLWGALLSLPLCMNSCRPKMQTVSLGEVYLPEHLTSPHQQRDYLVAHYWDKIEAQPDTNRSMLAHQIEDFCALIHGASLDQVRRTIIRPLDALSGEALYTALETYAKMLYTTESPHYNEAAYRLVLAWEQRSMKVDSARRTAAFLQQVRLQNNAVGHSAQDFIYYTSDTTHQGAHRLSRFSAPYTLLVLSVDSDQRSIRWAKDLRQHKALTRMIELRTLRPLVLYTDGRYPDSTERALWAGGTLARDSAQLILSQRRYDLSRGSALYLLDAKKTVLLRNTSIPQIANYLNARDEE